MASGATASLTAVLLDKRSIFILLVMDEENPPTSPSSPISFHDKESIGTGSGDTSSLARKCIIEDLIDIVDFYYRFIIMIGVAMRRKKKSVHIQYFFS